MALIIDFETRSEADLKKIGAHNYALHASTEIICLGYKIDAEPASVWVPGRPFPGMLLKLLKSPTVTIVAHNAGFELVILNYVLNRYIDGLPVFTPSRFRCTAAKSAAFGLPRSLEDVGAALGLPIQKDMKGSRLLKKLMKPTPKWKKWKALGAKGEEPAKWYEDPEELKIIYSYCQTDVEAEALVDLSVPDLIPSERNAWLLNMRVNARGVTVDVKSAEIVLKLINEEVKELEEELQRITDWEVTTANQRDRFLKWIRAKGVVIPNLQARTVEDTLSAWDE